VVYKGARKGKGLVVAPKDYSIKYKYWFFTVDKWMIAEEGMIDCFWDGFRFF
jgi:hypothetical protein